MQGTVRFELREEKTQKSGKAPIGVIYSVKGQRKRLSTGQVIYPFNWDAKAQQGVYLQKKEIKSISPGLAVNAMLTDIEIKEINSNLDAVVLQIEKIEREYLKDGIAFSSQMVADQLKDKSPSAVKAEEANQFLFNFIDKYIDDHSATRVKGSLAVYRALKVHLEAFEKHNKRRITFGEIDFSFLQSFQNFLIEHRSLANTTVAKQLSTLKTFLGYARKYDIKVNERYRDFQIKKQNLEVIALTENEFSALLKLDLSKNKKLRQVRDVFCFSCVTGFRYSDLKQLRREHIKKNEITLTVTKTKERLSVPLSKYSQDILNIYADCYLPLPVIAAANMNKYLKDLCKEAKIDELIEIVRYKGVERVATVFPKYELITVHTGRKTFVTLSLERGMSAEDVMACTGHSSYQSFKRYINVTEERKKKVISKAWGDPKQISK